MFLASPSLKGSDDYAPVDSQNTFEPQPDGQPSPLCISISIVDDNILEATETLRVEVRSVNPEVSPDPSESSATVEIQDNDRMLRS